MQKVTATCTISGWTLWSFLAVKKVSSSLVVTPPTFVWNKISETYIGNLVLWEAYWHSRHQLIAYVLNLQRCFWDDIVIPKRSRGKTALERDSTSPDNFIASPASKSKYEYKGTFGESQNKERKKNTRTSLSAPGKNSVQHIIFSCMKAFYV